MFKALRVRWWLSQGILNMLNHTFSKVEVRAISD
jgi:hypothetical protein